MYHEGQAHLVHVVSASLAEMQKHFTKRTVALQVVFHSHSPSSGYLAVVVVNSGYLD